LLVVSTYVFNKSKDHWLFNDFLSFIIFICLKLKKKSKISNSFDSFMQEESIIALELGFWASNSKKNLFVVFYILFLF
jgi:hypothetical protein